MSSRIVLATLAAVAAVAISLLVGAPPRDTAAAPGIAPAAAPDIAPAAAPDIALAASGDTVEPGTIDMGHTLGAPDAPIVIVEFSDFGCPYCGRFAQSTLPGIHQEFISTGVVRWRYVPITFGFPGGELMGKAGECVADQAGEEAFWAAHDLMYRRQVALRGPDARDRLLSWLDEIVHDRAALASCIDDPATRQRLEDHTRAAQSWNVRGTPTFVINGVPMAGALPIEFFRKVFATALDPSGM